MIKLLVTILITIDSALASESSGHNTHHEPSIKDLLFPFINFIVLFAPLWFLVLKGKLAVLFEKNAKDIEELYNVSEEKIKEANIKLEMYEKKMSNLDAELAKVKAESEKEAASYAQSSQAELAEKMNRLAEDYVAKTEYERKSLINQMVESFFESVLDKTKADIKKDKNMQSKATSKLLSQI